MCMLSFMLFDRLGVGWMLKNSEYGLASQGVGKEDRLLFSVCSTCFYLRC